MGPPTAISRHPLSRPLLSHPRRRRRPSPHPRPPPPSKLSSLHLLPRGRPKRAAAKCRGSRGRRRGGISPTSDLPTEQRSNLVVVQFFPPPLPPPPLSPPLQSSSPQGSYQPTSIHFQASYRPFPPPPPLKARRRRLFAQGEVGGRGESDERPKKEGRNGGRCRQEKEIGRQPCHFSYFLTCTLLVASFQTYKLGVSPVSQLKSGRMAQFPRRPARVSHACPSPSFAPRTDFLQLPANGRRRFP